MSTRPNEEPLEQASEFLDAEDDAADAGKAKDRLFVTSLARGLAILRCFTPQTPELRTTELARMTGLAQPTVWRLCHTMRSLGFLSGAAHHDRLRLGTAVLGLGYAGIVKLTFPTIARPYIRHLAEETGGAVSLGAREDDMVIYLERCHGSSIVFSDFRVGAHVPLATSPTGWALLAGVSKATRRHLIARVKPGENGVPADLEERIEAALADYEATGFVKSVGVMHAHLNAASVPLVGPDGKIGMALSCGGIDSKFPEDGLAEIGHRLKEVADLLRLAL